MPDSARIVASALRDPIRVVHSLGGDSGGICAAAMIDVRSAIEDSVSLPLSRFVALNQIAACRLRAPHFGRVVGAGFDFANIGAVGQAALSAPTLGSALRLVERAFAVVQDETELRLDVADGVACLSYRILDPEIWPRDQDAELTIAVFTALAARVAGPGWAPDGVFFEHTARGAEWQAGGNLECPVTYGAETNMVIFGSGLLDRAMPDRNLRNYQKMSVELATAVHRAESASTTSARVRRLVRKSLGAEGANQSDIARSLGLSRRTLRRHLAEEGTSFADILADCRDGAARLLLRQSGLTIAEIADRLGYSECSGFERAFLRRTGRTPAGYRRTILTG